MTNHTIPRALLAKIVVEVFDGAIEDDQVIRDIYAVIAAEPRATNAQILIERELAASAIEVAMAFGYQGADARGVSAWLQPFYDEGVRNAKRERDLAEADRRAGAAERERADARADLERLHRVRDEMKDQWGVSRNVSFDVVWAEALALKAAASVGAAPPAPAIDATQGIKAIKSIAPSVTEPHDHNALAPHHPDMTDRELLELAAKAAGLDSLWVEAYRNLNGDAKPGIWSPPIDSGDALRLAARLRMQFGHRPGPGAHGLGKHIVEVCGNYGPQLFVSEVAYDDESQEALAVRQAILRTAAEIGKACRRNPLYNGPSNCNKGTVGCTEPEHRVFTGTTKQEGGAT